MTIRSVLAAPFDIVGHVLLFIGVALAVPLFLVAEKLGDKKDYTPSVRVWRAVKS